MIENLRATNSLGLSINFDKHFRVTSGLDLSGLAAEVNATQTTAAGSRYQNTRLADRIIDLEFQIRRESASESVMDLKRAQMYKVFTPEASEVRFDFNLSNGEEYYFTAHTSTAPVMPPSKTSNNSAFQLALVQMVCTDPYIYKSEESRNEIALIEGGFFFPLEIPEGVGIELGTRSQSLSIDVFNESTGDIGMVITFTANAEVQEPQLMNVVTYENLKLNTVMQARDEIIVDTTKGKRSITLIRDNVRTNIFNNLDFLNSTFFQLHPGQNILRYDATAGLNNLDVTVTFQTRYVGV